VQNLSNLSNFEHFWWVEEAEVGTYSVGSGWEHMVDFGADLTGGLCEEDPMGSGIDLVYWE
jgi:hypothetical protein